MGSDRAGAGSLLSPPSLSSQAFVLHSAADLLSHFKSRVWLPLRFQPKRIMRDTFSCRMVGCPAAASRSRTLGTPLISQHVRIGAGPRHRRGCAPLSRSRVPVSENTLLAPWFLYHPPKLPSSQMPLASGFLNTVLGVLVLLAFRCSSSENPDLPSI